MEKKDIIRFRQQTAEIKKKLNAKVYKAVALTADPKDRFVFSRWLLKNLRKTRAAQCRFLSFLVKACQTGTTTATP